MLKTLHNRRLLKLYRNILEHGRVTAVVVVGLFLFVGIWVLQATHAATASLAMNAADGTLSGNAQTVADSTTSSGRAVKFGTTTGTATLAAFPQQASTIATFLAPGVKPPTNQWFSNLAFQEPSNPVFAYPLALQTLPTGFGMMYPKVVSTVNTVFGSYVAEVTTDIGAVNTRVMDYDDLSVSLEALDSAGNQVATYRLTQGSPIIYMTLKAGKKAVLSGPTAPTVTAHSGYYSLDINNHNYVAGYNSAVTANATAGSLTLTANSDAQIALGALPSTGADTAAFVAALQDPITGTEVGFGAATSTVSTSFSIKSKNSDGGLMALVPAQQTGTAPGTLLGSYESLMGTMKLYKFASYNFTTASTAPDTSLDVSKLTATEKSTVITALTTDINNLSTTGLSANDTYFGGKQLARGANLMQLAISLGQTSLAQTAYDQLNASMSQWLNPNQGTRTTHYFYYDTNLKGLVGVTPSFGSDTEFNDHHFHYGYFLYAAGLMSAYKPAFATEHAEVVNTLVRDIANPNRNDSYFPYLRPFDQYAGHSWASGTSPFADGNNNESSSEAVNAWYGLYLWAKSSGNTSLETQARWMYGRESNSALTYWTNFDRTQPQFSAFNHSVVSMVWGGKMDYGTWFSPSSYAKLGIQLLPMTPGSAYLGKDTARITTNLGNLNDGSAAMFTDVMAMYKSYANPAGAVSDATALADTSIDDGNSRAWLMAWVYAHNH